MMNGIDTALLTLWPPAHGLIVLQDSSSDIAPHVSTLCLPDVTARDQIFHALRLCICILQAIKYWPRNGWKQGLLYQEWFLQYPSYYSHLTGMSTCYASIILDAQKHPCCCFAKAYLPVSSCHTNNSDYILTLCTVEGAVLI